MCFFLEDRLSSKLFMVHSSHGVLILKVKLSLRFRGSIRQSTEAEAENEAKTSMVLYEATGRAGSPRRAAPLTSGCSCSDKSNFLFLPARQPNRLPDRFTQKTRHKNLKPISWSHLLVGKLRMLTPQKAKPHSLKVVNDKQRAQILSGASLAFVPFRLPPTTTTTTTRVASSITVNPSQRSFSFLEQQRSCS